MFRSIINRTPEEWLSSIPLKEGETPQGILATFTTVSAVRLYQFSSPHLFLRFHGRSRKNNIFMPNYWADGSALGDVYGRAAMFEGWLADDEIKKIAKTYYRDITAISHNWNDLDDHRFWKISLQGTEFIEGIVGPVAPQPTHQADLEKGITASKSILKGGAVQAFLFPKTPFVCTPLNW